MKLGTHEMFLISILHLIPSPFTYISYNWVVDKGFVMQPLICVATYPAQSDTCGLFL